MVLILFAGCASTPATSPARPHASDAAADDTPVELTPATGSTLESEGRDEAACWAQPFEMKEATFAPKPLSAFDVTQLDAWLRVQGGQCMSIPPEGSPFTTAAPMPESSCLYDAARLHFEHHQWPEAGELFRRIWERFPAEDASIYAAMLYLETLHVMGHRTEPPRPICYDVMTRDVERIACLYCQPGTTDLEQCGFLQRIRFELPFRDSGKLPFPESDVACPEGQRFIAGACRPLPPLTPTNCP